MDRRWLALLAVAALAIVALATAAATLDATVAGGQQGGGADAGSRPGLDGDAGASAFDGARGDAPAFSGMLPGVCIPALATGEAILALVGVYLGSTAYAWYTFDGIFATLYAAVVGVVGAILHAALTACVAFEPRDGDFFGGWIGNHSLPASGARGSGPGEAIAQAPPSLAFLVVVAAIGLLAGIALFGSTGNEARELPDPADPAAGSTLERLAARAGEFASQLSADVDVENEVYRAWFDMTELVGLEDDASVTPGEFAEAAVEVGLAERDVAELTGLFEEVRYGGEPPTGERVERAVAALRRIEAEHGVEDD